MYTSKVIAALALAASAIASFTLDAPRAVDTDPNSMDEEPCGGFDVTEWSPFTDWPTGGHDVRILNVTDWSSIFSLKVALLSDPSSFVTLYPDITTQMPGDYCFSKIRGNVDAAWVGQKAIFQMSGYVGNGVTHYQCAGVRFVDADQAPPVCRVRDGKSHISSSSTTATSNLTAVPAVRNRLI